MVSPPETGMMRLSIGPEMGFVQRTAGRALFTDAGRIIEKNRPYEGPEAPPHDRPGLFLARIPH